MRTFRLPDRSHSSSVGSGTRPVSAGASERLSEVESAEAELIGCGRDSIEFFVTRVAVRPSRIEDRGWVARLASPLIRGRVRFNSTATQSLDCGNLKTDVSDRCGEPGGVSPMALVIAVKNPGADAARLT